MSTLARKKIKRKNAPGNRSDLGWEHGVEVGSRQVQGRFSVIIAKKFIVGVYIG